MLYIIIAIILIILLYCLLLGCVQEHFTWAHPCQWKCKQKASIERHQCSQLNAGDIATCTHNAYQNGMNCILGCPHQIRGKKKLMGNFNTFVP